MEILLGQLSRQLGEERPLQNREEIEVLSFGFCYNLTSLAKTDDSGDVFRTGPQTELLFLSAENVCIQNGFVLRVEGADALRSVDLMPGDRQEITRCVWQTKLTASQHPVLP